MLPQSEAAATVEGVKQLLEQSSALEFARTMVMSALPWGNTIDNTIGAFAKCTR